MTIIAVRHTVVDVPAGFCYGQTDVETASAFDMEKEQVAQRLLPENFQAVYTSPLTRCRKLAEFVSKGIPVMYDRRLMELNFGTWEGQSWDVICRTAGAGVWFNDWMDTACPGGESYRQLLARVQEFLEQVRHRSHETVLLVTHDGVIRSLNSLLTGVGPQQAFGIEVDYGSITKFKME